MVYEFPQAQMLGESGRQEQAGIGHQAGSTFLPIHHAATLISFGGLGFTRTARRPTTPGEGMGRRGAELEMYDEVKTAASDAIMAAGGTITHHHAVGRLHRQWYDQQRPEPFAQALRAAKRAVDPNGVLNPGLLIDV